MNLNDIDLSHIKVAIFDFDATLAIHKDKDFSEHRKVSEENFFSFYAKAYKSPERFYDDIEPCTKSEKAYDLVNTLRKMNIKMYCLSGMKFTFHLKAKQAFVSKYYGDDIEVIATSSQELKLIGVNIIKEINNCELDEILFVDDLDEVVSMLKENGVKAINVQEI